MSQNAGARECFARDRRTEPGHPSCRSRYHVSAERRWRLSRLPREESADLLVPPTIPGQEHVRGITPDLAGDFRGLKRAQATDETQVWEYDLQLNGEREWFEARITRRNGSKILSVVRDITERKRLEALR